MKNFYLNSTTLYIYLINGQTLVIFLNANSGKVYYRFKVNTVSQVKHTGIYLGTDRFGTHYIMHNHYENGQPCIVTLQDFTKGNEYFEYDITPENAPIRVIEIALNEIQQGEKYDSVNYNCQTFVNVACLNKRKSDDVDKWVGRIIIGSFLFFGLAAVAGGRR